MGEHPHMVMAGHHVHESSEAASESSEAASGSLLESSRVLFLEKKALVSIVLLN